VSARRVSTLLVAAFAAALLAGCDAGKDPLARGAEAEGAGNLVEARARYQEVCAKGSKHCPLATRLLERLAVKEAWKAIGAGEYGKAKIALAAGATAADPAVKAAAEAASRDVEYVNGLSWEEAAALPDKEQALPRMEALVDLGVPASAQARAWLTKNRAGVLLARVKGACVAGSRVSCAEAGRALAALHPESPENAEAQRLVQADYARVYPLLKQAENLIIQRVEIYDKDQLVAIYTEKQQTSEGAEAKAIGDRHLPTPAFLDGAWKKKLEEIGDPFFVKALETRYARAGSAGEQDPEAWPKPAGMK
jgi:hypothetical protein